MRFVNGIYVNEVETFGDLYFCSLDSEVFDRDMDGNTTGELKERRYFLKSVKQGGLITINLPKEVELKEFAYNTKVHLVNPKFGAFSNGNYTADNVTWYGKADDIVIADKTSEKTLDKAPAENADNKARK